MKKCSKCKILKDPSEFGKNKTQKDGLHYYCKQCALLAIRKWSSLNPEKAKKLSLAASRKFRTDNPQKTLAATLKWQAINPENGRAATRRYHARNPEKQPFYDANRRAKKLQATPAWNIDFIVKEAYHLAKLREKATGFKWHVDHVIPLKSDSVCGFHSHNNIQVIPGIENNSKGNRYWPDMP